jgi:dTDP-glucose 4,6-dehydratase
MCSKRSLLANLLITGGAGFIGSNFVHHWVERHPDDRVVVLDALTYASNRANLAAIEGQPCFKFVHGDIEDQALVESLLRDDDIDTIVNFAAETHVDRSITGPDPFIRTNVLGTHALLKAARQVWLDERSAAPHRFHHISTDEVFGSLAGDDPPFTETSPYAPNSPYAASKAASDHLVRAYRHTYGLATSMSNCSNNYGPYQFPEKLIPLALTNLLTGKRVPVYGDGSNIRDWLHVADHCRGIELILLNGKPGESYNVGGNAECANLSLVNRLAAIVDEIFAGDASLAAAYPEAPPARGHASSSVIEFVTDRPGHDQRYAIDASKISRELGFASSFALEQGLRETVGWYLANPDWWQPLRSRD